MEPLPINIYLCERFLFAHRRNLFLITKHSSEKDTSNKYSDNACVTSCQTTVMY